MRVRVVYMDPTPAREFENLAGEPLPGLNHQVVEGDRLYAVAGIRWDGLPAKTVVVQMVPVANAGTRFEPRKIEPGGVPAPKPGEPPKKLGGKA